MKIEDVKKLKKIDFIKKLEETSLEDDAPDPNQDYQIF